MSFKAHQRDQETLYEQFCEAVDDHALDRALLVASQALSEARDEMETIASNAASAAAQHPSSALLQHVSARRQAQIGELRVFLAELA